MNRALGLAYGLLCALLFGLAAGAVWTVITLFIGRPAPWLVLPVGWILGACLRRWGAAGRSLKVVCAVLATLLAAFYTNCLITWARLSGALGIGFVDALRDAGPAMTVALARQAQSPTDWVLYLVGALLAAVAAQRLPTRISHPAP